MRAGLLGVLWGRTRRRQTPFSPSDIPNIVLWLDASDASTIQQVGGFVSQWNDKSGAGNNATQATGASQPSTGGATISGKNAISFDGANDGLSIPAGVYNLLGSSPCTVFIVGMSNNTGDSTQIFLGGFVGSFRRSGIYNTATSYSYLNRSSLLPTMITTVRDTNPHLMGYYRNGTQLVPWLDANVGTNLGNSEDITLSSMTIGSNGTFSAERLNGNIGEIIIYTRALSNEEINLVNNYLAAKWAVTAPTLS